MERLSITKIECPCCHHPIDRVGASDGNTDRRPKAGDLSLCFYCAEFSVFNDDMTLRTLTDQEVKEVGMNPEAVRAQSVAKSLGPSRFGTRH